jgi:hypothetical protein
MDQVVECLPSKCEVLDSTSSTVKRKEGRKEGKERKRKERGIKTGKNEPEPPTRRALVLCLAHLWPISLALFLSGRYSCLESTEASQAWRHHPDHPCPRQTRPLHALWLPL